MAKENNEKEIDLLDLIRKILNRKILILKYCGIGFIISLVIAFSIPKEYKTEIILAPDNGTESNSNVSSLASLAGINVGASGSDIINPDLFPEIAKSTPFLKGLFELEVEDNQQNIHTSLYSYLENYQKSAWWNSVIGLPFKVLNLFSSSEEESGVVYSGEDGLIKLTKKENDIINALSNRIEVNVNKKTGIISLSVTMQSPEISAFMADTVIAYLQSYVISYRTEKASRDLEFAEKLYNESKVDYYKAQQRYATFMDENMNVSSARYRTNQERLQNELTLTYGIYNQMAQQLQMARIKVQDLTPVYVVIEPAVIPLLATSPQKKMIAIVMVLLSFIIACSVILYKEFLVEYLKK